MKNIFRRTAVYCMNKNRMDFTVSGLFVIGKTEIGLQDINIT